MNFKDNSQCCVKLTEREIAVTWFFMTGMRLKQIAEWTGLKEKSVSYYKRRVMKKVGVKNNNELIMWFLENRAAYQCHSAELSILRRSPPKVLNK